MDAGYDISFYDTCLQFQGQIFTVILLLLLIDLM